MEEPVLTLSDLDDLVLQRIVDAADVSDLFLLHQVARRWRACVNQRTRRCKLDEDAYWFGISDADEEDADIYFRFPPIGSIFPNLTQLNLYNEEDMGSLADVATAAQQLPRLRSLSLQYQYCEGEASAQALQALSKLTSLYVMAPEMDTGPASVALSLAARCSSLQRLDLGFLQLPWPALRITVAKLAGTLTDLDLRHCWMSGKRPSEGLLAINTGKLQRLHITILTQTDHEQSAFAVCGQLAAFTSLTALDLSESEVDDDAGVWQLSTLTRLTSLNLDSCNASYADIARLSRLSNLAELRPSQSYSFRVQRQVPGLHIALASFPKLRRLDISNCDIGADQPLGALPHLTRLRASVYSADGAGVLARPRLLRGLTQLQDLTVHENVTHESQLRHLSALANLTRLQLSGKAETAEAPANKFKWLLGLTALQDLTLGGPCWSGELPLQQLSGLTALRMLNLDSVGPACDLRPLERLPLQWLGLPRQYKPIEQLPPALRVAALKGGRRGSLASFIAGGE